jgi:predicted secreted protein
MPDRSRRVVVLAHCHLNVNTKVHGLADYEGARADLVRPVVERGAGIVQLPCLEATFLGMRRPGMSREQYDTPAFRRHCRRILGPVIDTLTALAEDGCVLDAVIGVDGSPSCGVSETCSGPSGDAPASDPEAGEVRTPGRGVFMDVFAELLDKAGLTIPFEGVDERC